MSSNKKIGWFRLVLAALGVLQIAEAAAIRPQYFEVADWVTGIMLLFMSRLIEKVEKIQES